MIIDVAHGIISYGYITEVYSRNGAYYGFIVSCDPPYRTFFFHENERGVLVRGDYEMPVIIPLGNRFSGPTISHLKNPEVGDPVAYYPGVSDRGPIARMWSIFLSRKPSFSAPYLAEIKN